MNSTPNLKVLPLLKCLQLLILLLLTIATTVTSFGNEYVHIKVHVPKDQAPSIAVDAEPAQKPHKVIHHFHHHAPSHQRSRNRAPPKPKTSPLLESVILSDLDKPLHMSEHADYLNHAKELAEHLTETYVVKKAPPPPPPKKKVNTYTIIEEKQRPNGYDYESRPEHAVDTYRVVDSRPQNHHYKHQQHQHHHHDDEDDDDDVGYHYTPPGRHYRHKSPSNSPYLSGAYAEPAPVEEPLDLDQGYSYTPPAYANAKSARAPAHTLEAPEESPLDANYPFDYGSTGSSNAILGSSSSSSFRPSPQLFTQPDGYETEYAGPVPSRRRRPSSLDWPRGSSYSSALDSYNVAHVHGLTSGTYGGPYL